MSASSEERVRLAYAELAMEPCEVADIRKQLGLSVDDFAILVGVASDRTVRRWENGDKEVPGSVVVLLDLLMNCAPARELLEVGEYRPDHQ